MNEPVEWIAEHDAEVFFTSEHSLDIRVVNASPMGIFVPDLIGTGMKPRSSKRCAGL